jgi:hypothetical protein
MRREMRDEAEAFALVIETSLLDAHQAVEWARDLMATGAGSVDDLVDIAGAIRPHPLDAVAMLRRLPGTSDPVRLFRIVLRHAADLLRAQPDAWPRVTRALEQIALRVDLPEELAEPCRRLDDERALAEQGSYGDIDDVHAELLAFLELHAEP